MLHRLRHALVEGIPAMASAWARIASTGARVRPSASHITTASASTSRATPIAPISAATFTVCCTSRTRPPRRRSPDRSASPRHAPQPDRGRRRKGQPGHPGHIRLTGGSLRKVEPVRLVESGRRRTSRPSATTSANVTGSRCAGSRAGSVPSVTSSATSSARAVTRRRHLEELGTQGDQDQHPAEGDDDGHHDGRDQGDAYAQRDPVAPRERTALHGRHGPRAGSPGRARSSGSTGRTARRSCAAGSPCRPRPRWRRGRTRPPTRGPGSPAWCVAGRGCASGTRGGRTRVA